MAIDHTSASQATIRIRTFILETFPTARARRLTSDQSLLENGVLDSLGILDLVSYLEREFEIAVSDEDLVPEHFDSLDRLTTFVERKRAEKR